MGKSHLKGKSGFHALIKKIATKKGTTAEMTRDNSFVALHAESLLCQRIFGVYVMYNEYVFVNKTHSINNCCYKSRVYSQAFPKAP